MSWMIKRNWTDDIKLTYEEEIILNNILCYYCANKNTYKEIVTVAPAIIEDIYTKIGEVRGSETLPVLTKDNFIFKIYIYDNDYFITQEENSYDNKKDN